MGALEALILALYAAGITWFSFEQAQDIGILTAERAEFKAIADKCADSDQREGAAAVIAADTRAHRADAALAATAQHRQDVGRIVQGHSDPCSDASAGNVPDRLLDAERRFMENLHQHRLPTEP